LSARLFYFPLPFVREEIEGERVLEPGNLGRECTERAIQRDELGGPAGFSFSHSV